MAAGAYGLLIGLLVASTTHLSHGNDEQPTAKSIEEYKKLEDLQNVYVRKYLNIFEEMENKIQDEKQKEATEEVKLLVIQSWIYTLKPDTELLKDIFTDGKVTNIEEAKEAIVKKIRNRHQQMPVTDAILLYVDGTEESMKKDLRERVAALTNDVNSLSKQLESENDPKKIEQLLKEKIDKGTQLEELTFYLGFHKIARRMCLQTYVLDFLKGEKEDKFVIETTDGNTKKEFFMTPLKEGDFWSFVKETEVTRVEAKSV